jgi:hypothetical protein
LYRSAKLDPSDTSYVEAHGTGTAAGDPIEAASLSKIFSVGRSPDEPLKVGSIKSNVGHLEGGSGMAGVIKTILMLERAEILPNFDFRAPNPRIPFENWKLEVSGYPFISGRTHICLRCPQQFGHGVRRSYAGFLSTISDLEGAMLMQSLMMRPVIYGHTI